MRHKILIGILFIWLISLFPCASQNEPYPNYSLFESIKMLWKKYDRKKMEVLLDSRVKISLKSFQDEELQHTYPREKALGILEYYFNQIEVLEFNYDIKRMKQDSGVAIYKYRIKKTDEIYEKRLYFYLQQSNEEGKNKQWVITAIHEV